MRRQREEQMTRRRYESFNQTYFFEMQKDDREASARQARLRLDWSKSTDILISALKDKIGADKIFSTGNGHPGLTRSAVASFR